MDPDLKRVKIVDIVFAFKNRHLLQLLMKRGDYIIENHNKELIHMEKNIQNYISENNYYIN
jgi:hypothetical protein